MTEKTAENNQQKFESNSGKKLQSFLIKLVIFLAFIFFGYYGFKYLKSQQQNKPQAVTEVEKSDDNNGIFDISDEYKNQSENVDLTDLTVNELKEKGAEFIYQLLLKNQVQIDDLRSQIQTLKAEIVKNKNQERIAKMILVYVDLHQKISTGKNYSDVLKNLEILTAFDQNLQSQITKLKPLLNDLSTQEELSKDFAALIPNLIDAKNNNEQSEGVIAKIRHNISKLIVIRRIDGKNPQEVDAVIVKIEKSLLDENYQEALNAALSLDQHYHKILKEFLDKLNNALEVQKIDQEIFNYLKSLT